MPFDDELLGMINGAASSSFITSNGGNTSNKGASDSNMSKAGASGGSLNKPGFSGQNNPIPSISNANLFHQPAEEICEVKLPPYWQREGSPRGWFLQVEVAFGMRNIKNDKTMYNHLVTNLPQDILHSVLDIISRPPTENMYETLKKAIIERNSESEERRFEKLLSIANTDVCDRRPSEYFRFLENLAGSKFDTRLLVKIWMRRLPQNITSLLVATGINNTTQLLGMADRMWDAVPSNAISAVTTCDQSSNHSSSGNADIAGLISVIKDLSDKLQNMEVRIDSIQRGNNMHSSREPNRGRSQSRRRSFSRPRSLTPSGSGLCWYHRRFGSRATKCTRPCSFRPANNDMRQE